MRVSVPLWTVLVAGISGITCGIMVGAYRPDTPPLVIHDYEPPKDGVIIVLEHDPKLTSLVEFSGEMKDNSSIKHVYKFLDVEDLRRVSSATRTTLSTECQHTLIRR